MHDIDFLPPKYRDLSARRKIKFSRVFVVGAIILTIVGAAVMQHHTHARLVAEIESVEPLHATAELFSRDLKATRAQLKTENKVANLITYMQHPWPKTQLLAAIVQPLPDALSLEQITVTQQTIEKKTSATESMRRKRKPRARAKTNDADKLAPAERDLKHLRATSESSQTVVIVTGRTRDRAELYYYLARLGESDLIAKAELKSVEAAHDRPAARSLRGRGTIPTALGRNEPATPSTKFVARVVVVRGHGQSLPKNEDSDQQES